MTRHSQPFSDRGKFVGSLARYLLSGLAGFEFFRIAENSA